MNSIKLSICIPTYNRDKLLEETLNSIIRQANSNNIEKFEICVSDNASTDSTDEIIKNIKENTTVRINYQKNQSNLGFDLNMIQAVDMASGDYCWLLGSDDIALPGSLDFLLQQIQSGYDIYLFNRIDCDIDLKQKGKRYWLDPNINDTVYDFGDPSQFDQYTRQATSIGALYSFIGSDVFKRKKWLDITPEADALKSGYIHVYMLLSFLKSSCTLKYCSSHWVLARSDRAADWVPSNEEVINRIMIDIKGYLLMSEIVKSQNQIYSDGVLRVLHAERHGFSNLKILRWRTNSVEWLNIAEIFIKAGYSPTLILIMGKLKPLISFLKVLSAMRKKLKARN
jgi:abequosyltransferase